MTNAFATQVMHAIDADESIGFCLACGDQAHGVEPDARRYQCAACGEHQVFGAEELLLTSRLTGHAAARIANGQECPECHSRDTESNGSTEYRCKACDHRWGTEAGERYGY